MSRFVTFGEIMLRLTPPGRELLFQTNSLVATFGGAEANVAVSLANYGADVSYVTAAPANPLGDAMVKEMRAFGVRTDHILRKGERLGVYFTETGEPLPRERVPNTPLLGVCRGVAVYLLYNGILGDKSANGGNILTRATLASLPKHEGPKVIYAAGCLLDPIRLRTQNVVFRQTPYEIRVT